MAAGAPAADVVVLDADAQAHAGLAFAPVEPARRASVAEGFGQVLDPVPLADAVFARAAARTAHDVARKEYDRVSALNRDDANASTRELEAARAALERATLELGNAEARLYAGWGDDVAGRRDLVALVDSITRGRMALLRLDLPAAELGGVLPTAVTVQRASDDTPAFRPARLIGPAPTTDPTVQGAGFLALLENGPPPGTALVGRLELPERRTPGVRVPRAAVVWRDGGSFVYVALGDGRFQRRAVELIEEIGPDRDWLATGTVAAGESVVVRGAALLLSSDRIDRAGGR